MFVCLGGVSAIQPANQLHSPLIWSIRVPLWLVWLGQLHDESRIPSARGGLTFNFARDSLRSHLGLVYWFLLHSRWAKPRFRFPGANEDQSSFCLHLVLILQTRTGIRKSDHARSPKHDNHLFFWLCGCVFYDGSKSHSHEHTGAHTAFNTQTLVPSCSLSLGARARVHHFMHPLFLDPCLSPSFSPSDRRFPRLATGIVS